MTILSDARASLLKSVHHLIDVEASSYSSRKVIHDPIWGTTRLDTWEAALLDIPFFQRLRNLKQTGFAYFTYPTAEHSRFQHTLGAMHAAGAIFDSLRDRIDERAVTKGTSEGMRTSVQKFLDDPRERALLRLAALVHDLGHSFFSHTSERFFSLVEPFPTLAKELRTPYAAKSPGAAEIVVYLLVTSADWQDAVGAAWKASTKKLDPPTPEEWERIGRWAMGQEEEPERKFLADIISGPIDADKLDYIARDAYSAGLPITYDLERFAATVAVDEQAGRLRLTIPTKGINALEQLVMSRLVLNSYLYHHQKVRASEVMLERALVREYLASGSIVDIVPPWPLFAMDDSDLQAYSKEQPTSRIARLLRRDLPVRLAEFQRWSLAIESEAITSAYTQLLSDESTASLGSYRRRIAFEDELAAAAGLERGDIIVDVPKPPSYKDLEDLQIPNDVTGKAVTAHEMLDYHRWIEAYLAHRAYIRIFCPRRAASSDSVWEAVQQSLNTNSLPVPDIARRVS